MDSESKESGLKLISIQIQKHVLVPVAPYLGPLSFLWPLSPQRQDRARLQFYTSLTALVMQAELRFAQAERIWTYLDERDHCTIRYRLRYRLRFSELAADYVLLGSS